MAARCRLLMILVLGYTAAVVGQTQEPSGPHIGYVYPAGGQRGTTFRAVVGGQFLRGADEAYVSGHGVRASVEGYIPALDVEQLGDAAWLLHELVRIRWSARVMEAVAKGDAPTPPDHPWLRDLDEKSPAELDHLRLALFSPKKQMNAQIAEQVEIGISIDPNAPLGDRELRLGTPAGVTNPLRFQVGGLPEVREEETWSLGDSEPKIVDPPLVLNGRIMPGEVDRFRFQARRGMRLVVRVEARDLIPYLADAVPGWFQAAVGLYDSRGKEVAYADDYYFHPDPVILYEVPEDGVYGLEVRDALYRGRDDFVYRIAIGELPFVTEVFPLGGQVGLATSVSVAGWNLRTQKISLDTGPGAEAMRWAQVGLEEGLPNRVVYAVDTLPEIIEAEPNDTSPKAQSATLPVIINGRIASPGDVDRFRFSARAGDQVVAEVLARRLNSPLDSVVVLTDSTGAVVASNDDYDDRAVGLTAHQADSYLRAEIPQDGEYQVTVCDAQHQGGAPFAYRLRLSAPRPDFAVRLVPSSISLAPGNSVSVTVHAIRKDGFDGDIEVVVADGPAGFELGDARVPAASDSAQMTLTAPLGVPRQVLPLRLEARATVGGTQVTRPVVPAEDMMQAFLYRHLVPQQELIVAVTGSREVPAVWRPLLPGVRLVSAMPVQLSPGGTAQVQVRVAQTRPEWLTNSPNDLRFELAAAPRGVTLRGANVAGTGITLTVKADAYISEPGTSANLIVEAIRRRVGGSSLEGPQRVSLGVLPPIPIEVTPR